MILQSFSNPFGASKITDTKTNIEHLYVQATQNDQTQFYIDLDTFDPSVDIVHVQSNGLSLFPGEDFTINGNYIVLAEGVPAGRDIGIYIFQNFLTNSKGEILNGLESKLEVVPIQLVATEEGQTYFPIDVSYDPNKDFIKVDSGITSLFPGEDYEVGTNGITLVEGVPIGRTIGIYIYKNVILPKGQMQIHGSLIMEKSIPLDRLVDTVSTGTNSQTKIFPLQVVASIDNQTVFPIELDTFDAETDFAFVQSGVTNLFYGADFTIQNKNIILTEGVPAGRTLGIYVLKNVAQTDEKDYVSGANLTPGSVTPDKIGGVLPIEKGGTGATTVEEARYNLGAASNPNLLDNWYFGNPINQRNGFYVPAGTEVCYTDIELTNVAGSVAANRVVTIRGTNSAGVGYVGWVVDGVTYYANKSAAVYGYIASNYNGIYSIDRWRLRYNAATAALTSNGIKLYGGLDGNVVLEQVLEPDNILPNTKYTVTVLGDQATENNVIVSIYINGPRVVFGYLNQPITFTTPESISSFTVYIQCSNVANIKACTLKAAKLELGSQQTLARYENGAWVLNDPPPNKQQELAKCQRYFVGQQKSAAWSVASVTKSGYLMIPITLPVTLRSTSITTSTSFGGAMQIYAGSWTDISSISYSNYCTGNTMYLSASSGTYSGVVALEEGMTYLVRNVPNVSADL